MILEALEALIYDRIADLPDVDELDNEQIHAIAHEAALAIALHLQPVSYMTERAALLAEKLRRNLP